MTVDTSWITRGNCLDRDPELFHPVTGVNNGDRRKAKAICRACPVREECLEYAVTVPNRDVHGNPCGWVDGVWGGTVKFERAQMRRARGITGPKDMTEDEDA